MLSRTKPATGPGSSAVPVKEQKKKKKLPKLEEFLEKRDYTGAITLLEVCTFLSLIAVPDFFRQVVFH